MNDSERDAEISSNILRIGNVLHTIALVRSGHVPITDLEAVITFLRGWQDDLIKLQGGSKSC